MDRQEYLEERRSLATHEADSYKSFDTALLSFSSGAIALSVTFIEKFNTDCFVLLVVSWSIWAVSIILQLSSYIVSAKAMREEVRILNEQYRKSNFADDPKNKFAGCTTRLNMFAFIAFIVGTICFLIFISFNL